MGMTPTTLTHPQPTPVERPDWLPDAVWPFRIAELDVAGRSVAFTDTDGDGPCLLFCHIGMWSLMWRDVMLDLAQDHRCVTLDTPGVGLSSPIHAGDQSMTTAVDAVGAVIDALDLRDVVLVVHDLGGLAGLAAANARRDRIRAVAVVNGFAWRPRGVMLPAALRTFGSTIVRELDAFTGWLPRASSTRLGVGRHMSTPSKRAWRAGLSNRAARRVPHRLFADAARNRAVQREAETAILAFGDRPLLTVFGQFGDYLGFQRQWRRRRPDLTRRTVPRGLHFPMCDDPTAVAHHLREWSRTLPELRGGAGSGDTA